MGGLCFWMPDRTIKKKQTLCSKLNGIKLCGGCKQSSRLLEDADNSAKRPPRRLNSAEPLLSREQKAPVSNEPVTSKFDQKTSFLEAAAAMSLEKAVEVLDSLGSSMSDFNAQNGFFSGLMKSGGNKISILAFEVANTITKATNLFFSLSEKNVHFLKKEVLLSDGVQKLVSADMKELLIIAASDKREELEVFSREVVRFGDSCKDPQWHNLGRYFSKLDSECSIDKQEKVEVEKTVHELIALVKHTSELYHELHTLDRFEQDIRQNSVEVDSLQLSHRVESHLILETEMKEQRKLVESLKKKSLWSKRLEQIVEKLVDIVAYLHQAIQEAFGCDDRTMGNEKPIIKSSQSLGEAGLALHYANLIKQIDNIACRPASLPLATRENLYHSLPPMVKTALRFHLQMVPSKDLTISHVKEEMEKTLRWLVPIAVHTVKAHQGFGWVGEWANIGYEDGSDISMLNNVIRLQTLYHADKQKADLYILEMVSLLHHLINLVRERDGCFGAIHFQPAACRKPVFHNRMHKLFSFVHCSRATVIQLSEEDRDLLDKVPHKGLSPGISKSQEFSFARKGARIWAISKSTGDCHFVQH